MAPTKYRTALSVVPKTKETLFTQRCKDQLQRMNIAEAEEEVPILGTTVLAEPSSVPTYMAKLRGFVAFLLEVPLFDDSLIIFYPKTPRGIVTVEDKAVSLFLLSKYGKKGDQLKDLQVRRNVNLLTSELTVKRKE